MHKDVWCQIAELSIVTRRILIILLIKIILMPIILSELKSKKITDFLIRRNLFNFHISPCITFPPVNWLSSVQFSHWIVSDSLQPHEQHHVRPPCPPPTPGVHPNSCPLSRWYHPNISFCIIPFSSCSQSFQHQGLFKWVSSSHQVAKVLEFQLQHQSFKWTPRIDFL